MNLNGVSGDGRFALCRAEGLAAYNHVECAVICVRGDAWYARCLPRGDGGGGTPVATVLTNVRSARDEKDAER